MTAVIKARNVHEALPEACRLLRYYGVERESRYGKVRYLPFPAVITYERPLERVVFWPERDANPFFHFMESLWMLGGRKDVEFLTQFNARMVEFSDDGVSFNAAYGYRWRLHFGTDQLSSIASALADNPNCRRQVLQIWDARLDLGSSSKDLPCNTQAYFAVSPEGRLDMTVCNRSNDAIWGAFGANAVHFGFLLEYVANFAGFPVGSYHHFTNNLHFYVERHSALVEKLASRAPEPPSLALPNPYEELNVAPLMQITPSRWQRELKLFLSRSATHIESYDDPFFESVAKPLMLSWAHYRGRAPGDLERARMAAAQCASPDWAKAAWEWLDRRRK